LGGDFVHKVHTIHGWQPDKSDDQPSPRCISTRSARG
jgi:hypothetical protein